MEKDFLDSLIPVESESHRPNRWVQSLDIVGMVIAPLSISLPFFIGAIYSYQTASSTGTNYTNAIVSFFVALASLILLGTIFGNGIKLYVNHQATREKVKEFRIMYSGFISGSLILYFMIFYAFFFGPKP